MFTFENAVLSSNSVKEEGVLIVPNGIKGLHPLFVPKDRAVPFFLKPNEGYVLEDYFNRDSDELHNIFTKSSNLLSLWTELEEAEIVGNECSIWTVLDINSNIILEVSQINGYYDNMLEVRVGNESAFHTLIAIAYEHNFVLSKVMYNKYIEITKTDLFEELKNLGDDGTYTAKVDKALNE
jgi:hypothetical protein